MKSLVAIVTASILAILSVISSSAQSLPSQFVNLQQIRSELQLTMVEETTAKAAVLNGTINQSNQTDVLKLAFNQYLNRRYGGTNYAYSLSECTSDEWIIVQENESYSTATQDSTYEKPIVATSLLVLDESGNKITPSAALDRYMDLLPYESSNGLSNYFVYGQVTHYATVEVLLPLTTIERIRVNRIETIATNYRPAVAIVSSFTHYVYAGNGIETFYMNEDVINRPVSDKKYTLYTSSMGYQKFQGNPGGEVYVGAVFKTTGGNFEIAVRMLDIYGDW